MHLCRPQVPRVYHTGYQIPTRRQGGTTAFSKTDSRHLSDHQMSARQRRWMDPAMPSALRQSVPPRHGSRSEEHTSELQSLMRISYAVFCLNKKNKKNKHINTS